jgi:hypothetical protein
MTYSIRPEEINTTKIFAGYYTYIDHLGRKWIINHCTTDEGYSRTEWHVGTEDDPHADQTATKRDAILSIAGFLTEEAHNWKVKAEDVWEQDSETTTSLEDIANEINSEGFFTRCYQVAQEHGVTDEDFKQAAKRLGHTSDLFWKYLDAGERVCKGEQITKNKTLAEIESEIAEVEKLEAKLK